MWCYHEKLEFNRRSNVQSLNTKWNQSCYQTVSRNEIAKNWPIFMAEIIGHLNNLVCSGSGECKGGEGIPVGSVKLRTKRLSKRFHVSWPPLPSSLNPLLFIAEVSKRYHKTTSQQTLRDNTNKSPTPILTMVEGGVGSPGLGAPFLWLGPLPQLGLVLPWPGQDHART